MHLKLTNIKHKLGRTLFNYNVEINHPITAIYGPSGAGKTTLINLIAGLEKPQSGSITFNKTTLFDDRKQISVPVNKRQLGIVFQDNYLFPHLNIHKNLCYSQQYLNGRQEYVSFNKIVSLLEIESLLNKKPSELSGGERQRVAIGRTLLSQPKLLLLDEPFSNLDRQKRKQIISYLLKINDEFKVPLLIISHDLEDVLKLTNQLLIVKNGCIQDSDNYLQIAEKGEVSEIISHKRFLNIIDAIYCKVSNTDGLASCKPSIDADNALLLTHKRKLQNNIINEGQRVRICIHPDDIALGREQISSISIQNQLKGLVTGIKETDEATFVFIDCGFKLISEITRSSIKKLKISIGDTVYCYIKSQAIEVVHIYE
ncbi:molybdenum ABC transporter ATP-binding protein [Labilibacter sediminis]|nr:molybdenum ABC transporter ATP-binding protein [Labilibacter sediminis]